MLFIINLAGLVGAFIFFMKVKAIKAKGFEESEDAYNPKCEWSSLVTGLPWIKKQIVDLYPNKKDMEILAFFGGYEYTSTLYVTDTGILADNFRDFLPYQKITRVDWVTVNIPNTVVPKRDIGLFRIFYVDNNGQEDCWRVGIRLERYYILADLITHMNAGGR